MKKASYILLLVIACILPSQSLDARARRSLGSAKTRAPKAAYSGFGKRSKSTGRIKTKSTRGHFKKSNGYKFVNSYARS